MALSLLGVRSVAAIDADDLDELLGYTMVAYSYVSGDFEGADFDKVVKLDNGMVFEFMEYSYAYAYHPSVAVFADEVTVEEARTYGQELTVPLVLYKLVIDDDIYDATRLR
jgi:hypothetical protein